MDIKRLIVADAIGDSVLDALKAGNITVDLCCDISPQKLVSIIHEYDAIMVRSRTQVTRQLIEAGKNLKLIARAGVGVDNIDVEAATENNILVINAPNGNTISACELTCAHIINISRHVYQSARTLKDGIWNRKDFVGVEVAEKTLGIVGLGRIGREVGIRMKAFKMNVIGYDPYITEEQVAHLGIKVVSMEDIWRRSDYITFHIPMMPETRYILNRETMARCKDGVYIINVARGGIVEEKALLDALLSRKVSAAALDVFEEEPPMNEELIRNPHLVPTPHLGGSTHDAQRRVAEEMVDQILNLKKGLPIPGGVNANKIKS